MILSTKECNRLFETANSTIWCLLMRSKDGIQPHFWTSKEFSDKLTEMRLLNVLLILTILCNRSIGNAMPSWDKTRLTWANRWRVKQSKGNRIIGKLTWEHSLDARAFKEPQTKGLRKKGYRRSFAFQRRSFASPPRQRRPAAEARTGWVLGRALKRSGISTL